MRLNVLSALLFLVFPTIANGDGSIPIKITGVKNFMAEKCLHLKSGDVLSYHYRSEYPLDFNVHYHTEKTTEFYIDKKDIASYAGDIAVVDDRQYCFMWTNKTLRKKVWSFNLIYALSNSAGGR